jgi:hypothetical protein
VSHLTSLIYFISHIRSILSTVYSICAIIFLYLCKLSLYIIPSPIPARALLRAHSLAPVLSYFNFSFYLPFNKLAPFHLVTSSTSLYLRCKYLKFSLFYVVSSNNKCIAALLIELPLLSTPPPRSGKSAKSNSELCSGIYVLAPFFPASFISSQRHMTLSFDNRERFCKLCFTCSLARMATKFYAR